MATYMNMFQRIARSAGFPAATADFSNGSENTALIKELINESNQINSALTPARPKSFDISLVAGQADYTLPADFGQMRLVNYYQGTRLIQIYSTTPDKFLTLQSVISNSTLFIYYMVRKLTDNSTGAITNVMSLYPTPGSTGQNLTIQYDSFSTALNVDPSATTDSTVNLVAVAPYEQIDKMYGLSFIFTQREQPVQAKNWQDEYDKWFKKYADLMAKKTDSPVVKQGIRTQMNPNLYPVLS